MIPEMFQRRFHNICTMENHIYTCCSIEYSIVCLFTNYNQVQQIDLKEIKKGKTYCYADLAKVCAVCINNRKLDWNINCHYV